MKPRGFKLTASAGARTSAALLGALKMAHLAGMSEEEFGEFLKEMEGGRVFQLLKTSGAINLAEFPSARYAARRYAGYGLKLSGGDLPELADGNGDLVGLVQGIGQEKFEACFLKDAVLSDAERAEECAITVADAARLRDFVNRAFIQAEFEGAAEAPASKVFSAVAGICQAAQEIQGDPEAGAGYELSAIAIVVIGGTSLMGGRGGIGLTLLGAMTIGYLEKILSINAVGEAARLMLTGLIVVGAVLFQRTRK